MRSFAQLSVRILLAGIVTVAVAACGGAQAGQPATPSASSPAASPAATAPAGDVVSIVARNLAFTEATVAAPADRPFRIAFENAEGAPHNVAVYRDRTAAEKISIGEIFGGPATKTQEVPALAPGDYFFRCDVHPDMVGTLAVR